MGVITGNPVSQPKHLVYAQMTPKNVFVIMLCESGISDLDIFSQQAFFGCYQVATAVCVYGSPFKYNGATLVKSAM